MSDKNTTMDITLGGENLEVKMSFGMLNEIARQVGSIELIGEIAIDPNLRDSVITSLLSKRDAKGKIIEQVNLFTLDMETDEVTALLHWAGGHVADFFLNSLEKTKTLLEDREGRLKALMPTSNGGAV